MWNGQTDGRTDSRTLVYHNTSRLKDGCIKIAELALNNNHSLTERYMYIELLFFIQLWIDCDEFLIVCWQISTQRTTSTKFQNLNSLTSNFNGVIFFWQNDYLYWWALQMLAILFRKVAQIPKFSYFWKNNLHNFYFSSNF